MNTRVPTATDLGPFGDRVVPPAIKVRVSEGDEQPQKPCLFGAWYNYRLGRRETLSASLAYCLYVRFVPGYACQSVSFRTKHAAGSSLPWILHSWQWVIAQIF